MSAANQDITARDRIRSALKVSVLALTGTASVVLAALALSHQY